MTSPVGSPDAAPLQQIVGATESAGSVFLRTEPVLTLQAMSVVAVLAAHAVSTSPGSIGLLPLASRITSATTESSSAECTTSAISSPLAESTTELTDTAKPCPSPSSFSAESNTAVSLSTQTASTVALAEDTPISEIAKSATAKTEALPAPKCLALQPPFLGKSSFDFSEIDSFTMKPFWELIAEHRQLGLPYFLAATQDGVGNTRFFDGASLMKSYYKFENKESPLNRMPFTTVTVYRLGNGGDQFEAFCDFNELLNNSEHYAKFMLASDPGLPHDVRGKCRYYVGGYYEFKEQSTDHLDQAEFWYRKTSEDDYFAGPLAFANWHEQGIHHFAKSITNALKEYKRAMDLIPPDLDDLAHEIYEKIKKFQDEKAQANPNQGE